MCVYVPVVEHNLYRERQFGTRLDGGSDMDVTKILADLRQEKEQLEEAILSLERLAAGRGRRRGRPPAWMSEAKKRGRPPGSKNKPKSTANGAAAQAKATASTASAAAA
jgi:hypothetical protein